MNAKPTMLDFWVLFGFVLVLNAGSLGTRLSAWVFGVELEPVM